MWYLAAIGSNSQRFSGELLVPLSRCCCRFSRDYSDPQSCSALADSCLKTLVAAEVSSSFFEILSFLSLSFPFFCVCGQHTTSGLSTSSEEGRPVGGLAHTPPE